MQASEGSATAIERFEGLAPRVWPPARTQQLEGWLLGFTEGCTKRANSVHCRGAEGGDALARVEQCEALYRELGQKVVFKLTEASRPAELDDLLASRGYELVEPTSVQLQREAPERSVDAASLRAVRIDAEPSDSWLAACMRIHRVADAQREALAGILRRIARDNPGSAFAAVEQSGEIVAQGVGALRDGTVCLCEIATDPERRRRGHALTLVAALCDWARQQGATPWLQVVAANQRAVPLYHALGFREMYRHWYRVRA